jgi:hypothetical protein
MARSLNKKYFGNRNIGTNGTSDDAIGGEGVASVTITNEGSYTSALPTATFSAPDLPTGVRATGTVHGHALTAVATAAGSGYHLNDVLTLPSGSGIVTPATFRVTGLKVTSITINNGGTANDVGDVFQFAIAGFATPLKVRVTASSTGTATAVSIEDAGVWTSGALPTNTIGMTRTQTAAGQDFNGQNLQVNITGWGVATVAVVEQGDYTTISSGAKATTVAPAGGSSATLTVTYGVSGVVVDQKGSGYTSTGDAGITFNAGAAAATPTLTTDSGTLSPDLNNQGTNASDNQENAIIIYANTDDNGSKIGDIIRQVGARRFKVRTADGTAICELKGSAVSAYGEMTITATDSAGGTYFVTKIGGRKATVTRGTGTQFATGSAVPWTFGSATLNQTIKIQNA